MTNGFTVTPSLSDRRWLCLLALVVLMVCSMAGEVLAARVKCPVCGQTFNEDLDLCPNDGTNLELLGKPLPDEEPSGPGNDDESTASPDGSSANKYKRHDQGGERMATPRSSVDTYSDRHARLADDRRGSFTEDEAEELQAKALFEAEDKRRSEGYRRQRESAWGRRHQELADAKTLRKQLLERREQLLSSLAAPLTSLGTRLWWMSDQGDAGTVVGAEVDVNLVRDVLRIGLSTSLGVRFAAARGDILFLETLSVGAQLPWRFSPYVVGRVGIGGLSYQRAEAETVNPLGLFGVDVGVDVWTNPWLCLTPAVGYAFLLDGKDTWHTFTGKLSVGF